MPRSAVPHREGTRRVRDVAEGDQLEVSVYLKPYPRESGDQPAGPLRRETHEQMRARRVVEHEQDIAAVTAFAAEHGLRVVSAEPERRLVRVAGSAGQFGTAFGVTLGIYDAGEGEFRSYSGTLSAPAGLAASIESVLGLDNRPVARPYVRYEAAPGDVSFRPNQLAELYHFPENLTGWLRCTGIIELGGGYRQSDIDAAFSAMGLHPPTVIEVLVDGGTNNPGKNDDADIEVALDIQVAGGVAPRARLAVYFAPNTDQGFVDAVTQASHDQFNTPSAISISWGKAEKYASASYMDSMTSALADAATLGISVFAAAGDHLASDGVADGWVHVDFPASSPWAIGCGGTAIETSGTRITQEVVWTNNFAVGTGGGISDHYPVPAYQGGTRLPPSLNDGGYRRGVPDVAGVAGSVHQIVVNGEDKYVAGTSAVSPLWAGLTARLNELAGLPERVGFFTPVLYGYPAVMRDIVQGSNAPVILPWFGYKAGPGWDACTGLGVPEGGQLAILLACKATRLTPLTAVAWADGTRHMRVFCHTKLGELSEFRCDDSWQPGATLPGPTLASKLSAVEWNDAQGVHLRIYYQDPQNVIREQCYDGAGWQQGRFAVADAAPGTSLAAVAWTDSAGLHQRVYYQDGGGSIREQFADHGAWDRGTIVQRAAVGGGLGALLWTDAGGTHVRVFYHDRDTVIREQWSDGGSSWQPGPFVLPPA